MSENVNKNQEAATKPQLPTGTIKSDNPTLSETVELDNPLKQFLVQYVGDKFKPKDEVVTVGLTVQALAEDFPEFLMVVAEENWIRGYQQGIDDSEEGVRLALEEAGVETPERLVRRTREALEQAKESASDE